jgi:hypothetical protein
LRKIRIKEREMFTIVMLGKELICKRMNEELFLEEMGFGEFISTWLRKNDHIPQLCDPK